MPENELDEVVVEILRNRHRRTLVASSARVTEIVPPFAGHSSDARRSVSPLRTHTVARASTTSAMDGQQGDGPQSTADLTAFVRPQPDLFPRASPRHAALSSKALTRSDIPLAPLRRRRRFKTS